MKTIKLRCFLLTALATVLLTSGKVFAQVVPTVSIVSVSPKSIPGTPWINATITYTTNEPEILKFYVDYVLEGSATSSMVRPLRRARRAAPRDFGCGASSGVDAWLTP